MVRVLLLHLEIIIDITLYDNMWRMMRKGIIKKNDIRINEYICKLATWLITNNSIYYALSNIQFKLYASWTISSIFKYKFHHVPYSEHVPHI